MVDGSRNQELEVETGLKPRPSERECVSQVSQLLCQTPIFITEANEALTHRQNGLRSLARSARMELCPPASFHQSPIWAGLVRTSLLPEETHSTPIFYTVLAF